MPIDDGRGPLREFLDKSRSPRWIIFPMVVGMVPEREFPYKSICKSVLKFPIVEGSDPLR